jgi:hypothetical protein
MRPRTRRPPNQRPAKRWCCCPAPDHRLFTNASLLVAENAAFLVALFSATSVLAIEFADELTGASPANPLEAVARGKLAPLMIQLLIALGIFGLAKGFPLGRPREGREFWSGSRRVFADHVRALGLSYAKARAGRFALGLYGGYAIDRLRERLAIGSQRGLSSLAEAIASRTGRPVSQIMQLLVEVHDAKEEPPSIGSAERTQTRTSAASATSSLRLMRELSALLQEIGGKP